MWICRLSQTLTLECQHQPGQLLSSRLNGALKNCATCAQPDYLFLCGLRKSISYGYNLWNLHNYMPCWANVCRYNNWENGAVDRPTLLLLHVSQTRMFQWLDMILNGRGLIPGSGLSRGVDVVLSFCFRPGRLTTNHSLIALHLNLEKKGTLNSSRCHNIIARGLLLNFLNNSFILL